MYIDVFGQVVRIPDATGRAGSARIWNPHKVFSWYIPGIYQVYTFSVDMPGIYLVYPKYMFSR